MNYFKTKVKSVLNRWKRAVFPPNLRPGTKFPVRYRLRKFLSPTVYLPSYIESPSKARHYLSSDPTDDRVIEEMFDTCFHFFFPEFQAIVQKALEKGGWIVDIGAYNGSWGVEFLKSYPKTKALFLEPNPEKSECIERTLTCSEVRSRGRVLQAALSKSNGYGWLVASEDGSWGDWLSQTSPSINHNAFKVETITLKKALNDIEPIVLKCNAEGGEFELIKQLLFMNIRPEFMILMVHPEKGDVDLLWERLIQLKYSIIKIRDHIRRPVWHAKRMR